MKTASISSNVSWADTIEVWTVANSPSSSGSKYRLIGSVSMTSSTKLASNSSNASVVDLQLHHEVTLNQIVSAAWVFCRSVGALNVDARHLLKRIFQYVHLGVVAE
jgi:hypothetical protein